MAPSITQLSSSSLCLTRRSIYFISPSFFRSLPLPISHQNSFAFSKQTKRPLNIIAAANLPFDLSPPPIDHDLLDTTISSGAIVSEDGIAETFNNDDEALDTVDKGTVVVDLSHFGRIRVSGEDRAHFLHNQSTANFDSLREGQGCDTVFVTPTARTIDIAHAWIMKTAITLVVSPEISRSITEMLNKYIFFADKVEVEDITTRTKLFVLVGPNSNKVISNLNMSDLVGQPYGSHRHYSVNRMPVTVAVGNIISEEGFSLMMAPAAADSVWKALLSQGAIPMGSNAWEKLRILQGILVGDYYDSEKQIFTIDGHVLGITLEDVLHITGLPISGKPVLVNTGHDSKAFFRVFERFDNTTTVSATNIINIATNSAENYRTRKIAVLLVILFAFVAPNDNKHLIDSVTVQFVEKLEEIDDYAWGAALLAYMYYGIERYKGGKKGNVDGNLWILLTFFIIRLKKFQTKLGINLTVPPENVKKGEPWLNWILHEIKGKWHDHYIKYDLESMMPLSEDDIYWTPYAGTDCPLERDLNSVRDLVPLFCYYVVVHHKPQHCSKQFPIYEDYDLIVNGWKDYKIKVKQRKAAGLQNYFEMHQHEVAAWHARKPAELYMHRRPVPGKELTNEYNVLEAGLWNSISLDKGCYKGQETISRLITYDGIKQRLWGIHLSSPVEPGSPITVDGKKVGKLTSYTATRKNSEHFGLGYIKRSGASEGDTVTVGDNVVGKLTKVPYIAHQRQPKQKAKS